MSFAVAGWIEDFIDQGGYAALGALILLENLFPPIPSEAVLPLAGFFVERGTLDFIPALLFATAGSVVGAMVLYAIGRVGGRPVLKRWGPKVRLDEQTLDRADDWFDKHGQKIVLIGRLVPGVRSVVSIPAGLSEMPVGRFLVLTAIGSAIWNAALIGAGVALGSNWEKVETVVGPASYVAIAVVVAGAFAALYLHRRRRAARKEAQTRS